MSEQETLTIYCGVCMGGALDGEWLERDTPQLSAELPKIWLTPADGQECDADVPMMPSVLTLAKTHDDYRFVAGLTSGSKCLGIWALIGVSDIEIYKRLVGAYAWMGGK